FEVRPTEVVSAMPAIAIHFFVGGVSNIVDEQSVRARLDRESEWIAQSQIPDQPVVSGRGVVKGIVGWDRAVGIDADDLAKEIVGALRDRAAHVVADRDIDLAIFTEMD